MALTDLRSPDGTFTLFVVLPTEEVCTLRRLPSGIYVNEVKGKLEVAAGLPSYIYRLTYPDGECLSDKERLLIQENVRDGYLLRVQIMESWEELYQAVIQNNTEYVYHSGGVHMKGSVVVGQTDEKIEQMVQERSTAALFVASFTGLMKMCNLLTSIGVNVNGRTHFGRTALHAAVCKDRIHIVNMLLDAGASVHIKDVYSKSPVDLAKSLQSFQSEKRLRLMQLNLRGQKDTDSFGKQRVFSTSHLHDPNKFDSKKNYKPKATSAGGNSRSINATTSSYRQETPQKLLSARTDKNNNVIKSNVESFWVISQTSPISRELDSALEKKYRNFLENNDKLIQSKQYPSHSSKSRIIKFRKDSSEIVVAKSSVEEHKSEVVKSVDNMDNDSIKTQLNPGEKLNGHTGNNKDDSPSPREQDEHNRPTSRKSSLKSKGSCSPKNVRFSAKARSVKNLMKPETMESFKEFKRRISLAANRSDSAHSSSSRNSGISHESWLRKKQAEERRRTKSESSDSSNSDADEDSDAFKEWVQKKKEAHYGPPRQITRPIHGLIQLGSTDIGDGSNPDPIHNIKSYNSWISRRQKSKKIPNVERLRTLQDFMAQKKKLEEKRQQLLMTAITYEEWMDYHDEKKYLIQKILRADFEQLQAIEKEEFVKRVPHQISYDDWVEKAKKRKEEELVRQEKQRKFLEEEDRYKKVNGKSSAAIPHSEWLRLKRTAQPQPRYPMSPRPDSLCGSAQTRKEAEEAYVKWSSARRDENSKSTLPIGQKHSTHLISVK